MTRWILQKTRNQRAEVRLFCFPHAGGGASSYSSWANELAPSIDVCPVQLPGHENRAGEPLIRSIRGMAAAALPELAGVFDRPFDRPFALFGHSMGSLVAFELARLLRRHRLPMPFLLIASGHVAPHVPLQRRPIWNEPNAVFIDEIARMEGTPAEILADPDMLEFFLPPLRADFEACDRYEYAAEAPLDVPIVAMGGSDDRAEPWHHVASWDRHTTAPFTFRLFSGGHFFLHRHRPHVLAEIREAIENVRKGKEKGHGYEKSARGSVH
jgi:medium-chain acyl-[acyl-carrier-protein] hydrolase